MPGAVILYRVYGHLFALFNFALAGVCVWFVLASERLANEFVSQPMVFWVGLACLPLSLLLAAFSLWTLYSKRVKQPWNTHMANIVAGIATIVLAPMSLFLLFVWFKPEVKAWYQPERVNRH